MAKAKKRVISEVEAKEILAEAAKQIQAIDERIEVLKEDKREVIKNVKDLGLSTTVLNEAIKRIRRQKKNKSFEDEVDLYMECVESYITPLKD